MSSILFLNRVYPPAEGSTGQLLAELAEELVRRGHAVTVVTSRSTSKGLKSDTISGVRIARVGGLPFTRASHLRRALGYLSLYPAMLWRALRLPRHDIVVTLTDPPLQSVLGPILQWRSRSKLVHWAQDVYPELAEELGVLNKGGWIARLIRRLSTWALKQSDGIIVVGQCMRSRLVARGIATHCIEVIPNWGHEPHEQIESPDAGSARGAQPGDSFRSMHGLDGKFVVMYSGNLGLAHPFESILDAAERLHASHPEIAIVFVGNGPRLAWVRGQVEGRGLTNVRFLPFQPAENLAKSLGAADLHLASMRHELCGLVVPSKVYGVLAAGRPCVFLGPEESEAAQILVQNACGSVLENATGSRLAACIAQWLSHPESLQEARGRAAEAAGRVNLDSAAGQFEQLFLRLIHSNTNQPDVTATPAIDRLAA
jgi:glycosyltransferase involved in cell wall biosynthesis